MSASGATTPPAKAEGRRGRAPYRVDIRKKMGRAAVMVTLTYEHLYETERYSITVPVEGLHYDRDRRQVRWDIDGASVVCARYRGFWRGLAETGRCPVEMDETLVIEDDDWKKTRYRTLSVECRRKPA